MAAGLFLEPTDGPNTQRINSFLEGAGIDGGLRDGLGVDVGRKDPNLQGIRHAFDFVSGGC